jgi:hypothetical protein
MLIEDDINYPLIFLINFFINFWYDFSEAPKDWEQDNFPTNPRAAAKLRGQEKASTRFA